MSWTIEQTLKFAREATQEFMRQMGPWNVERQVLHNLSEIMEFEISTRQRIADESWADWRIRSAEEIWDIIFSALTNAHIIGISDEHMVYAFNRVVRKIQDRMKNNYYAGKKP